MEPSAGDGTGTRADEPLHPIGEAARLTGVSRGVLRLWERERLVSPKRTSGGHRLYSGDDLRRLRQVVRLRRMDRLNVAAIRRELGAADGTDGVGRASAAPGVGARLRALRTGAGRSLAEVAAASGLSVSFLSAVERGQANPSVGNLFKLADAYGTTVPGLDPNYRSERRSLLHPQDRPRYVAAGGLVVIEDLLASPGALEAQRIEVRPGGGSEEAYAHPGEEFVYVLSGQLVFWIDERERYALAAGDSLSFRSTRPHRWRNDGDAPATVLWINVPVVEPATDDAESRARARRHPEPSVGNRDGGGN